MSEAKRVREMEELIGLQASAIIALQQAAQALQIALQALEKAMADKGEQTKIVFVPQPPLSNPNPFYNPLPMPYVGGSWPNSGQIFVSNGIAGVAVGAQNMNNSEVSGLCSTITNTTKHFNRLVHASTSEVGYQ